MITKLYSAALQGVDAVEVEVEVNARKSENPRTVIVGLPDAAVRESGERVHSAVGACSLKKEIGVHTINLAPADLRKEGLSFDLPIALAMASCGEQHPIPDLESHCVVGELALDGQVRPVKGALSIALEAKRRGRHRVLLPAANAPEAAVIDGIDVFPIAERVVEVADKYGKMPAQISVAWLLSKPDVSAPIVGVSRVEQLEDLVAAAAITLEQEDIDYLEELYHPVQNLLSIGFS